MTNPTHHYSLETLRAEMLARATVPRPQYFLVRATLLADGSRYLEIIADAERRPEAVDLFAAERDRMMEPDSRVRGTLTLYHLDNLPPGLDRALDDAVDDSAKVIRRARRPAVVPAR